MSFLFKSVSISAILILALIFTITACSLENYRKSYSIKCYSAGQLIIDESSVYLVQIISGTFTYADPSTKKQVKVNADCKAVEN